MVVVKFLVTWGLIVLAVWAGISLLGFDRTTIMYGISVGVLIMAFRIFWEEMSEG